MASPKLSRDNLANFELQLNEDSRLSGSSVASSEEDAFADLDQLLTSIPKQYASVLSEDELLCSKYREGKY